MLSLVGAACARRSASVSATGSALIVPTPVPTTIFLDALDKRSFAPPGDAQPALTADAAIAVFETVDPVFKLPRDATAELGLYTDAPGDGSYLFRDRLVWGYTWYQCAPNYGRPHGSPRPDSAVSCTEWLFLDANTGEMLAITWQSGG